MGDLDSELGQLEAALQSDPSSITQMQLNGVLSLVEEDTPVDTRLRALKAVLAFQVQNGSWRDAVQASQQIVMIYRSIKEESLLLPALTYQGKLMARAGMVNEAETAFTEVLFKLKAAGGPPLLAHLLVMSDFALFHGSPQRAFQFLRDASALEPGSDRLKLDMANCLDMLRRHEEASKARQINGPLAFQARWEQAKSFERRALWNDCLSLIESTLPLLGPGLTPEECLDWKAKWIGLKGQVLQPLGRLVEAETAQIEIYQELMQVRGIQSLDTATSAANLARLWQHQKRLQEAEQGFVYAHSIYYQQLGEAHQLTQGLCDRIIECSVERKDYGKAEYLVIETMKSRSKHLGDQHPLVGHSLNMLGRLWLEQRRFDEAKAALKQALDIYERYPSTGDFQVLLAQYGMGAALQGCYQYHEAESYYQTTLQLFESYYPPNHALLPHVLKNYGWLLRQTGRDKAATEKFAKAEKILTGQLT